MSVKNFSLALKVFSNSSWSFVIHSIGIWAHAPKFLHVVLHFTHNVLMCRVECSQLGQGSLVCFGTLRRYTLLSQ